MKSVSFLAIVAFASTLTFPGRSSAQVVAKQGVPDIRDFRSPMILELPLPNLANLPIGAIKSLGPQLQGYSCEGVSVPLLVLKVSQRKPRTNPTLTIDISGAVRVPPSRDRFVDLAFVILKDGKAMATARIQRLDAEEDRPTTFDSSVHLNEGDLKTAFTSDPPPRLQLTVSVADNG